MKTFDLIMPCYNEEAFLKRLVVSKILPLKKKCLTEYDVDLNLIIVNDASTDGSLKIAEELVKEYPWITLLTHEINSGKGAAIRTGLSKSTADYIGIQDADEEYTPDNYLKLLKPMIEGKADVVYGSRYLRTDTRKVLSFWHTLINKFLTLCSNMFTGLDITDMETCYKLFTRRVAQNLAARLKENRFGFEPEITAYVADGKYAVYECAIDYSPRSYEEGKKITYKDGIRALYCIAHYGIPLAPSPMKCLLYFLAGCFYTIVNLSVFELFVSHGTAALHSVIYALLAAGFLNYALYGALTLRSVRCMLQALKRKFLTGVLIRLFFIAVIGAADCFLTLGLISSGCPFGASKLISSVFCYFFHLILERHRPIKYFNESK